MKNFEMSCHEIFGDNFGKNISPKQSTQRGK